MNNCDMVEFIMVTKTISGGVIAGILMLIALLPFLLGTNRKKKDDNNDEVK